MYGFYKFVQFHSARFFYSRRLGILLGSRVWILVVVLVYVMEHYTHTLPPTMAHTHTHTHAST